MNSAYAPPATLEDVCDVGSGMSFPRQALSDSKTALCLFTAAFYGRQDVYWIAQGGLEATCVDHDQERLDHMRGLYPSSWEWITGDVYRVAEAMEAQGRRFDVVTLDSPSNHFQTCSDMLPLFCEIANNVVILAHGVDTSIVAPDGWQVVQTRKRSTYLGGIFWTVLEPTGAGITADRVSACLVTRGDQPKQLARIIDTLPYDEVIVWDNSLRDRDYLCAGRYAATALATHDVVYFQDDDTLFTHHDELMAAYEPGMITAVYGHGDNDGGYGDLPLVCGGGLADKDLFVPFLPLLDEWGRDELAYADFHVGVLTPFKHVHLPFEINMPIAQHPSRLVNQPWAADAKARVTERARAIRDSRA